MKQKYKKPELVVIEFETEQIICDSPIEYGGDGNGTPAQTKPFDINSLDFDKMMQDD